LVVSFGTLFVGSGGVLFISAPDGSILKTLCLLVLLLPVGVSFDAVEFGMSCLMVLESCLESARVLSIGRLAFVPGCW
jgi:hypothetical protein